MVQFYKPFCIYPHCLLVTRGELWNRYLHPFEYIVCIECIDQSVKASKETQCKKAALGETEEEKTKGSWILQSCGEEG